MLRSPGSQYQNAYFEKTLFSIRELLVEFMTSDDPSIMKGKLKGIEDALKWFLEED